jgi:hypothetical protein
MALTTYSELVTACENHLHRGDMTDRVPEFISIGEARIGREVKAKQMEQRVSTTPTDVYVALPSDYISMRGVRFKGATIGWLDFMTPDQFFNTTASSSSSTINKYTIFGDELVFPVTPSSDVELWYYKRMAALSSAVNTLFTDNPDLYLYAALAAAAPFQLSSQRLMMFEGLYQQVKESVNLADKQGRFAPGMAVKVA